MATYENTRLLVPGAGGYDFGISSITTKATDFGTAISNWNAARKTRKELSKLSDRVLDDIGICRADIATFTIR